MVAMGGLSLPEFGVASFPFDERTRKQSLVAVVDGVVGTVGNADQELGVEDVGVAFLNIPDRHRVHVVDVHGVMDLVTFDSHVASVVSDDDVVAKIPPFPRGVETLVHPTVKPKGRLSDLTSKGEVAETLFESFDPPEL